MGSRLEKNSESVRKRIERHSFRDEEGDEYEGSKFGGFNDYFRRKKIKLQNLDAQVRDSAVDKPKIFRGIVAHVNGYTQPSLNDLHHMIVSHGGGFMQYLDGKTTVTHIIASNLTPKKAIEFRRYRIVKPAWIVDSVAAGKLLPWDAYRVLDEGSGQRLLCFDDGKVVSQVNTPQRGYKDQTNASWYTSQVKDVVEDIDDEDGAHFPSTQRVSMNGVETYLGDIGNQPKRYKTSPILGDGDPSSSANYDVTSSLEEALKNATTGEATPNRRVTLESPTPTPDTRRKVDTDLSRRVKLESPTPTPEARRNIDPLTPSVESRQKDDEEQFSPIDSPSLGANARKRPRDPEVVTPSTPSKKVKVMTAEEHNAILLADPHIRKSSTANPEFLKQYYSESRLHHLSTWKADLKSRFQQMASERSASQKLATKRKPGSRRYVMHVDFDSFFCAVSLKSAPGYVDKPAVVAHGNGTGSEIASCNYPAREFGVKNGMWMEKALELCPNIKVLPYDFPAYEEASRGFYEAILDIGGIVQSVSIDEALVDISSLCIATGGSDGVHLREGSVNREQEKADSIGHNLRARIKENTGCAVSIGIGDNILLAKVALRKAKPAGQYQIKPEGILDFLSDLDVQSLPGIAHSIGSKLEEIGVKYVKDVRQLTKDRLMTVLGPKTGERIWDYSRGIDRTEVGEQVVRKSVSAEVNWGIRFISQPEAEEFVQNLCIELQRRLLDQRVKGKQFTMKIMRKAADAPLDPPKHLGHGKCDTFNKSVVLGVATNNAEVIGREAISILRAYGFSPGELRGLGVQMKKLELLKPAGISGVDSSQRRINFRISAAPKLNKQITDDPIDDPPSPVKQKDTPMRRSSSGGDTPKDPIDEAVTPQKPKAVSRVFADYDPIDDIISPPKNRNTPVHPAIAIAKANADLSATKLLNLTGTQFVIPTQIDPEVLAELPQDIRSKLMAQSRSRSRPISRAETPVPKSRSESPVQEEGMHLPSSLDPEVFEALPPDMKAEILASYKPNATRAAVAAQTLLPQSPRKAPPVMNPRKVPTPKKPRGRGRPPGALNRPKGLNLKPDPYSGYQQSAFVAPAKFQAQELLPGEDGYSSDTLDPDFLSALPEDVRLELLTEHKRRQTAKKASLGLTTAIPHPKKKRPPDPVPFGQRRIRLPPREPRPTFTTGELSSISELRDTISNWFQEFSDEGPYEEDVAAMERYLRRVVLDERDLSKVVSVVRWLQWLVDEEGDVVGEGLRVWRMALEGIKEKVQDAVKDRGLGRLEL